MKEISVISIPFYEFEADSSVVNSVLEDIEKLEFRENNLNKTSTSEYYHPKLFNFFDESLIQVRDKFLIPSLELPIVACWVNKSSKIGAHHYHYHPNSFISGIFYLTTHDDTETTFTMPNPWYNLFSNEMFIFNKLGNSFDESFPVLVGKVKPTKGKLVLFPSNIKHKVSPNIKKEIRYTISFNTFFSGKFGDYENNTVRLEIKSTSVKDRIILNKEKDNE